MQSDPTMATVNLSTIQKYNRLDAEYYLGPDPDEVQKAKKHLQSAKRRYREIRQDHRDQLENRRHMLEVGEVVRYDPES